MLFQSLSKKVIPFLGILLGILYLTQKQINQTLLNNVRNEVTDLAREDTRLPRQDYSDLKPCTNRIRRDHIKEVCSSHRWPAPNAQRRMMFVVDDYKLLYCDIPKCGSTTFKTILGDLVMPVGYKYDMDFYTDVTGYRMYDDLSPTEQRKVMNEYFKMVVLRHPFDRLRSTYMDKLMLVDADGNRTRNHYKDAIKEYLIEKGQVTEESFDLHKDILTFEQFLELVAQQNDNFKNIHWDSYWDLCSPCEFDYDLVIKLETVNDDVGQLYDYLRSINGSARLPEEPPRKHIRIVDKNANRLAVVSEMLQDISDELVDDIAILYRKDLIWAGYGYSRERGAFCKLDPLNCC